MKEVWWVSFGFVLICCFFTFRLFVAKTNTTNECELFEQSSEAYYAQSVQLEFDNGIEHQEQRVGLFQKQGANVTSSAIAILHFHSQPGSRLSIPSCLDDVLAHFDVVFYSFDRSGIGLSTDHFLTKDDDRIEATNRVVNYLLDHVIEQDYVIFTGHSAGTVYALNAAAALHNRQARPTLVGVGLMGFVYSRQGFIGESDTQTTQKLTQPMQEQNAQVYSLLEDGEGSIVRWMTEIVAALIGPKYLVDAALDGTKMPDILYDDVLRPGIQQSYRHGVAPMLDDLERIHQTYPNVLRNYQALQQFSTWNDLQFHLYSATNDVHTPAIHTHMLKDFLTSAQAKHHTIANETHYSLFHFHYFDMIKQFIG